MIDKLLRKGEIKRRATNKALVKSLIEAAKSNAEFAKMNSINKKTATGVFNSLYDAFRQLGDANWCVLGYESKSHYASISLLTKADIKNKYKLKKLEKFRLLRNDSKYRGFKVSTEQADSILKLWEEEGENLISFLLLFQNRPRQQLLF